MTAVRAITRLAQSILSVRCSRDRTPTSRDNDVAKTASLHSGVGMHYKSTGMEPSSVRGAKIPRDGRTGALLSPRSGISEGCRNDGGGAPMWRALLK